MPKHDLPDGRQARYNVFDFRDHLQRRVDRSGQDNDAEREPTAWEVYRRAENSEGKRPRFSRFDLIWLALLVGAGLIVWMAMH